MASAGVLPPGFSQGKIEVRRIQCNQRLAGVKEDASDGAQNIWL